MRKADCLVWLSLFVGVVIIEPISSSAQVSSVPPNFGFEGRYLVVASDTDMLPSSYIDQKLGPAAGPDELSVIQLGKMSDGTKVATIPVSNSVIGPPSSIALTPDGRCAIIIETKGQRPAGLRNPMLGDLPTGRTITVVDLADPANPKVVQKFEGFENPLSVSINASGTLAAIVYKNSSKVKHPTLAFYRIQNGQLSEPIIADIPGVDAGDALVSAEFHPKENLLGMVYSEHPRLFFVRVANAGEGISLTAWGDSVNLDTGPFLVRFTADGRFALVNAMLLGTDIRGSVSSIKLEQSRAADGTPHHALVSRVDAGFQPEGLAISPDQRWIATTNLEHSTFAVEDPKQGYFASVSLLRFDAQTGSLERVGEFPFDGRLPEAVVFDNSSRFLAVACFAYFNPSKPDGSIDFWRIAGDYTDPKRTVLVKLDFSIRVARGPQSMVIAR